MNSLPLIRPKVSPFGNIRRRKGLRLGSNPTGQPLLLTKLTPELILYIADFLKPHAIFALSMCCHATYSIIGKVSLNCDECHKYLILLKREYPKHILCIYCQSLHECNARLTFTLPFTKGDGFFAHGTSGYLECVTEYFRTRKRYPEIDNRLSHPALQKFKRWYQKGHRPGKSKAPVLPEPSYEETEDRSAQLKVVNGSFLLRQQRRVLVRRDNSSLVDDDPVNPALYICPHIVVGSNGTTRSISGLEAEDIFTRTEIRKLIQNLNPNPPRPRDREHMRQCRYCTTEFRLDSQPYGPGITRLIITKWRDLGEAKSPLDYKYGSHFIDQLALWREIDFRLGSICAAFEGNRPAEFDPFKPCI